MTTLLISIGLIASGFLTLGIVALIAGGNRNHREDFNE